MSYIRIFKNCNIGYNIHHSFRGRGWVRMATLRDQAKTSIPRVIRNSVSSLSGGQGNSLGKSFFENVPALCNSENLIVKENDLANAACSIFRC